MWRRFLQTCLSASSMESIVGLYGSGFDGPGTTPAGGSGEKSTSSRNFLTVFLSCPVLRAISDMQHPSDHSLRMSSICGMPGILSTTLLLIAGLDPNDSRVGRL